MSEEKIQEIIERIEKKTQEIKDNPEKIDQYLMAAGIVDKNGNTKRPYK
jgi:ABC-type transport system substrate-binding protein